MREAVLAAFDARQPLADWPRALTAQLAEKYADAAWNARL
jgi:hypothetical protein